RVHEDVDFAADAEVGQIDSRLNGKTGARQDAALLARFEVVHVGPVAMNFLANGVARTVAEVLSVASLLDDASRCIVDFPALQGPAVRKRLPHLGNRRVARRRHNSKDVGVDAWHFFADKASPG